MGFSFAQLWNNTMFVGIIGYVMYNAWVSLIWSNWVWFSGCCIDVSSSLKSPKAWTINSSDGEQPPKCLSSARACDPSCWSP